MEYSCVKQFKKIKYNIKWLYSFVLLFYFTGIPVCITVYSFESKTYLVMQIFMFPQSYMRTSNFTAPLYTPEYTHIVGCTLESILYIVCYALYTFEYKWYIVSL